MQDKWVQTQGQEDLLEKEMATHSRILAWRIPWTEELGGLQSTGPKESDTTERLHFHFHPNLTHDCGHKLCVCTLSVQLFATPCNPMPGSPVTGFSRQEY